MFFNKSMAKEINLSLTRLLSQRQILSTGNLPQGSAPVVLILISLQRWQHRVCNETKHFVSWHRIGPQLHQLDLASK